MKIIASIYIMYITVKLLKTIKKEKCYWRDCIESRHQPLLFTRYIVKTINNYTL